MNNAYSILMLCFSGMLLLYAAILAIVKDPKLIPRNDTVEMKDPKKYAVQFSKIIALMAVAPFLSAVSFPANQTFAFVVLAGAGAVGLWLSTKMIKDA